MYTLDLIHNKIQQRERISVSEALWLADSADVGFLGSMAYEANRLLNEDRVYFNRNIHIEPTNICINHCLFCSYRRKAGEEGSWLYSISEMLDIAYRAVENDSYLSEIHIVGGVHPDRGLFFYSQLIEQMHIAFPEIHIKAFTAEEIVQMCRLEGVSVHDGLILLQEKGLMSLPGGGAEIFDPCIRKKICPDKISGDQWLQVHKEAHQIGLSTNATMLYGHYDSMVERINHLSQLRLLQDETHGFNAFIPLKFKSLNNKLTHLGEASLLEDLKTFAISRIFLDNFQHIKAYWPMLGIDHALLFLQFGVDDIDGTITDTTKIYSMAGGGQKPSITSRELVELVKENNRIPVERDSLYHPKQIFK